MKKEILENSKKGSYSDEWYNSILEHLRIADENNVLNYSEVYLIREAMNRALLRQISKVVRERMSQGATFTFIKNSSNGWLDCEYSDKKLTLEVAISIDKDGDYYMLGANNIRRVENNDEHLFSIDDIIATQNELISIIKAVFDGFNKKKSA